MPLKTVYQVQYLLTDMDTYEKTVIKEMYITTEVPRRDLLTMERLVNTGLTEELSCRVIITRVDEDCIAYKEAVQNLCHYIKH